jgi:polyribonucleotide 5'-hydroxyl-kinase
MIDCCQATFSAPAIAATVAVHELRAESEWRFEVAIGQKIEVRVSISIIGPNL